MFRGNADRGIIMITKKELAEELKISLPTIDRQLKLGMPHINIGKAVRFELEEVIKWLKEQGNNEREV
jgi:excisionase family DNA binding protein